VTGVQTCALPIWEAVPPGRTQLMARHRRAPRPPIAVTRRPVASLDAAESPKEGSLVRRRRTGLADRRRSQRPGKVPTQQRPESKPRRAPSLRTLACGRRIVLGVELGVVGDALARTGATPSAPAPARPMRGEAVARVGIRTPRARSGGRTQHDPERVGALRAGAGQRSADDRATRRGRPAAGPRPAEGDPPGRAARCS